MKKNGKFYSSPIPLFLKNFSVEKENQIALSKNNIKNFKIENTELKIKQCLPLLLKNSDLIDNKIKRNNSFETNLTEALHLKMQLHLSLWTRHTSTSLGQEYADPTFHLLLSLMKILEN